MSFLQSIADSGSQAAPHVVQTGVEALMGLLLVAVTVAIVVRWLHFPYTVALVLVGLVAGALRQWGEIPLTEDLILLIFLPPLLFEGCLHIDLEVMRRNALSILLLALPGTLITVFALGAVLRLAFGFDWTFALLLGAILSPTDPVSVLATFKEAGVRKDLSVIVEGESVFNDGIGIVLFLIFLRTLGGEELSVGLGLFLFCKEVFIGLVVGLALGVLAYLVLRAIEEDVIEVVISVLLSYSSYIVAAELHGSGVIAVVAAGLILGNFGRVFTMAPSARITLASFWEVAAFLANSLVFLIVGVNIQPTDLLAGTVIKQIAVGFAAMMGLRAVVTYGLLLLARTFRGRPPLPWIFVAFWGGLRGTIPIALVLMAGPVVKAMDENGVVRFEQTQATVYGVVLLSLLVQGLTIKGVLAKLGLVGADREESRLALAQARDLAARAAEKELADLHALGEVPEGLFEEMRGELEAAREKTGASLAELLEKQPALLAQRRNLIRMEILEAQRVALAKAARRGIIPEDAYHDIRNEIDRELDRDPGSEKH